MCAYESELIKIDTVTTNERGSISASLLVVTKKQKIGGQPKTTSCLMWTEKASA